ncbi:1-acyl-sn-glycerol-3-phosphate acyltransferase alpha-like [Centruroides sculpturatus]|uniref:1-acyl-sn-glycerol-3-phosphate acyltransferase alpha-like n=1 Tax=Centruroides sculpturatus TaxID=218467 RepID=UPI000C6DD3D3|nr:1-acyl-sn-glycerol-3-phosphate acyltransferase alpha-like [Centruroides sculpturatus]
MVDNLINPVFSFHWEIQNPDRIIKDQSAVIVCNHQSALDVIGMMHIWPFFHPCLPVLKQELFWSGPFGIFCWLAGCVFLNRSNSEEARKLLNAKMNEMKEKKIKCWIFPEGTRNNEGHILPFKKGAFHIAVQSQLPIIPIVYTPYSKFYNPRERKFETGKTTITVLQPISTNGLTIGDIPMLTERVRNLMIEEFSKY